MEMLYGCTVTSHSEQEFSSKKECSSCTSVWKIDRLCFNDGKRGRINAKICYLLSSIVGCKLLLILVSLFLKKISLDKSNNIYSYSLDELSRQSGRFVRPIERFHSSWKGCNLHVLLNVHKTFHVYVYTVDFLWNIILSIIYIVVDKANVKRLIWFLPMDRWMSSFKAYLKLTIFVDNLLKTKM